MFLMNKRNEHYLLVTNEIKMIIFISERNC